MVGPVDLSRVASREEAAQMIRLKRHRMFRRRGADHQRRLWGDPSWRLVNLLVDFLRFAVFILDVEL